mmetsp:Transcript_50678/g.84074  ORF Transcript_50678/g.84074 Transcript_50678/m.84074 type:complete len:102 (-) Transcript_50678:449-754(-)
MTSGQYRRFYLHHVSHYYGMDIHDTPNISRSRPLQRGMAFTIEPGLYIPDEPDIPKRFRGIGIRIEDNIVISPSGEVLVMSSAVPKELDQITALVGTDGGT